MRGCHPRSHSLRSPWALVGCSAPAGSSWVTLHLPLVRAPYSCRRHWPQPPPSSTSSRCESRRESRESLSAGSVQANEIGNIAQIIAGNVSNRVCSSSARQLLVLFRSLIQAYVAREGAMPDRLTLSSRERREREREENGRDKFSLASSVLQPPTHRQRHIPPHPMTPAPAPALALLSLVHHPYPIRSHSSFRRLLL